jgi:hypothetical protein
MSQLKIESNYLTSDGSPIGLVDGQEILFESDLDTALEDEVRAAFPDHTLLVDDATTIPLTTPKKKRAAKKKVAKKTTREKIEESGAEDIPSINEIEAAKEVLSRAEGRFIEPPDPNALMGDKDHYTVKYLHENDWDLFCKTYRVRDGQEKQDLDQAPRNPYYAGRKTILTVIG